MKAQAFITNRLVKSEDLNHHGTLFAGRCAEWFVENGFIATASLVDAKNIVCKKIHGFVLNSPIRAGQTVCFESKIVHTGKTSLVTLVKMKNMTTNEEVIKDGFITFVHLDGNSQATPHGITLELTTEEDLRLDKLANELKFK